MAAININNINSNNNGHNHSKSSDVTTAATTTTDIDPKDQKFMQQSQTPTSQQLSDTIQLSAPKQQVDIQTGTSSGGTDIIYPSNNIEQRFNQHPPPQTHPNHHIKVNDFISIKSKIGVEFRRYSLRREDVLSFDDFYKKIESFHQLSAIPFVIFYRDSEDFPLPINNDDNLAKAISSARHIVLRNTNRNNKKYYNTPPIIERPFLKLFIEKKGFDYYNGNLTGRYKKSQHFKGFSSLILPNNEQNTRPSIGMPEDFRQVSSIIDVDIVPETCRRVRIVKHGSDRPLGFYIRDGTYKRMNAQGQLEMVTGIFISRLVPGGLAESTGLLAVNDEVLEVNGIQVTHGKTLDQVTDMMVANSSNLIITIRPGKINNLS